MPELLAAVLVDQLDRRAVFLGALEVVARDVVAEDALGQLVLLEQRRAGEADEGRVRQRQPHVARELAGLRAVRLVGNHDDVVALAVGLLRVHVLVELVDQAEDVAVVLLQQLFEVRAGRGARRLLRRRRRSRRRSCRSGSSRSLRSVISRKVNLPGTLRRTFSAKNAIEYDLPLPCVCQNTPSWPRSGCARSTMFDRPFGDEGRQRRRSASLLRAGIAASGRRWRASPAAVRPRDAEAASPAETRASVPPAARPTPPRG